MIDHVGILGGGSAGFLTAIAVKARVPGVAVTVIRSKEIGIIGVGEGTTASVPRLLHGYMGIEPAAFHRVAQPTWKLGIKFIWGPRPRFHYPFIPQVSAQWSGLSRPNGYYCREVFDFASPGAAMMAFDRAFARSPNGDPVIEREVAYHLENRHLVEFLEQHAAGLGVRIVEDTVLNVRQDERGIAGLDLRSGAAFAADLYVDCSGFASVLLGKALAEPWESFAGSLFCDRAIVGGWDRGPAEVIQPYTTSENMEAGWCWRIDHEHRVNRGYVYSSAFISDEAAEAELRAKNPKVGPTRIVRFVSGHHRRAWVRNVVAIGNADGFVEPLEATSLAVICAQAKGVAETLVDADRQEPGAALVGQFNARTARTWECIRQFLAIHYRFNTRFDTPFWRECRAKVDLAGAAPLVEYYQENGPSVLWELTLLDRCDPFGIDGYLTLLVGQQVPYRRAFEPSAGERATWGMVQEKLAADARAAMTVKEALAAIRSPGWRWNRGFYEG